MLVCIIFMVSVVYAFRNELGNQILIWIDNRLDYERALDVGDEFNKVVWGDLTIQINHYKSGNKLDYVKNNDKKSLLEKVKNYKISENKLYVIANDGYAVVDENNVVKIFTTSNQKFILDNVKYLNSFESFEDDEQKMLKKLK